MHEYNHHINHARLDSKTSNIFDTEEISHHLVAAEGKEQGCGQQNQHRCCEVL